MQRPFGFRFLWALLFGLITAGLVFVYLRQVSARAPVEQKVPIVVAAKSVSEGTELTSDMLKVEEWPATANLPGALGSVSDATGKIASNDLVAGQPVLSHQIHTREHIGHGGEVPLGMRLLTIAVDDKSSIGFRLHKGDKVDIVSVYKDTKGLHSELALQSIEVYALGEEPIDPKAKPAEPRTVTLIVKPQDGLLLALLAEEKSARLMLRPSGDTEELNLVPVIRIRQ